MSILVIVVHIIVCIALILIVLLQTGKGADMGAAFGGGSSQTLFGSTGASTFLSKATTAAAVVFMLTSLTLAYMSGNSPPARSMTDSPAPIEQPAAAPSGTDTQGAEQTGARQIIINLRYPAYVPKWWNLVDTLS
jgi:preprotein translocase subunit SecG